MPLLDTNCLLFPIQNIITLQYFLMERRNPKSKNIVVQSQRKKSLLSRFCKLVCLYDDDQPQIILTPRASFLSNQQEIDSTQMDDLSDPRQSIPNHGMQNSRYDPNFKSAIESGSNIQRTDGILPPRSFSSSDGYVINYPVTKFREMEVLVIGDCKTKMLGKITSVRLMPSKESIEKTKHILKIKKDNSIFSSTPIDEYWKTRYYLFEKFDKGIKIDKVSWFNTLPESVAEHIAMKSKCTTILDGLCGVGSAAIKFANTCHTVLVNDPNSQKLECLENNIFIYGADNIVKSNKTLLELAPSIQPDIVYLHPLLKHSKDQQLLSINPLTYYSSPSLEEMLCKSLELAANVVVVFPPNINIDQLGVIYHNALMKTKPTSSVSCSLEVEKIYFNCKLKNVAVYYGHKVNRQFDITQQLNFIYKILNEGKSTVFKYKNTVKHIRSKYGMVQLLDFTSECLKYQQETLMDRFFEMIKVNQLLPQKLLETLKKPSQIMLGRLETLEQKNESDIYDEYDGEEQEKTEKTNSYTSDCGQIVHQFEKSKQSGRTIFLSGRQNMKPTMEGSSYMEKASLEKTTLHFH